MSKRKNRKLEVSNYIISSPFAENLLQQKLSPFGRAEYQKGYHTGIKDTSEFLFEEGKTVMNEKYQEGYNQGYFEGNQKNKDSLKQVYAQGLLKGWKFGDNKYLIVHKTNNVKDQFTLFNNREEFKSKEFPYRDFVKEAMKKEDPKHYKLNKDKFVQTNYFDAGKTIANQYGNTYETPNFKFYTRDTPKITLFPENVIEVPKVKVKSPAKLSPAKRKSLFKKY